MVGIRAIFVLLAFLAAASAKSEFFETFNSGWNSRWTHSDESKYNGRFTVETPEGLDQPALKASPSASGV